MSASRPGFFASICTPFEARFDGRKSNRTAPPIDRNRKALKQQSCFASKALHISPIFAEGSPRPFLRN